MEERDTDKSAEYTIVNNIDIEEIKRMDAELKLRKEELYRELLLKKGNRKHRRQLWK